MTTVNMHSIRFRHRMKYFHSYGITSHDGSYPLHWHYALNGIEVAREGADKSLFLTQLWMVSHSQGAPDAAFKPLHSMKAQYGYSNRITQP